MVSQSSHVVLCNIISVKEAANWSGYSLQYIRRLLRCGKLADLKIGQVWLIEKDAFDAYLQKAIRKKDRRFGSKKKNENLFLARD